MSLSLTTTGTTGQSTYNSTTGVLNIPNYADISKLILTVSNGGGPATYVSGTLHIPIYAPAAPNQVLFSTPATRTTSSASTVSTGYGVGFTALYNASVLVAYFCYGNINATNAAGSIYVYRTTGTIPGNATAIPGGDVQVAFTGFYTQSSGAGFSNAGIVYDTTLTAGTAYNYYFAFAVPGGGATYTFNSGASLQLTEAK